MKVKSLVVGAALALALFVSTAGTASAQHYRNGGYRTNGYNYYGPRYTNNFQYGGGFAPHYYGGNNFYSSSFGYNRGFGYGGFPGYGYGGGFPGYGGGFGGFPGYGFGGSGFSFSVGGFR